MVYIHTGILLSPEKDGVPTRATTWMDFEDMLSRINDLNCDPQKGQILFGSSYEVPEVIKIIETESRMVIAKGYTEWREQKLLFKRPRIPVWDGEKF